MKYERLTKIESDKEWVLDCDKCENKRKCWKNGSTDENYQDCIERIGNRLAELEDKIEQGTLKELPCKIGDTVYCVYAVSGIQEWEVMNIAIYDHDTVLRLGHKGTNDYNAAWLKEKGTYLFFTPEEAKQRLKELQE